MCRHSWFSLPLKVKEKGGIILPKRAYTLYVCKYPMYEEILTAKNHSFTFLNRNQSGFIYFLFLSNVDNWIASNPTISGDTSMWYSLL